MKCFLAGHRGMVGQAIARQLGHSDAEIITRTRAELDLTDQAAVRAFFRETRPDTVILAAAKVGGILANSTYPAEFLYENLMIQNNVIHSAHEAGVERLLFLGSSCIYPKFAEQPITESALLTGPLEETNEPYAIAKIAGIKLCESYRRQYGADFRSVMPSNLYGPNDNFHPENSHVIPGLIRRFHEAASGDWPEVTLWGTGSPTREFLHVDDMASASLFVLGLERTRYEEITAAGISHINVGSGDEISIRNLATLVARTTGFRGQIVQDTSKPDGTPRKVMDSSLLRSLGWTPGISLESGLADTYAWYLENAL